MEISSSAGYATALNQLNVRSNLQTEQIRQTADQQQQQAQALQSGTNGGQAQPAATQGRGRIVDITA